jgi:hypothetical protein
MGVHQIGRKGYIVDVKDMLLFLLRRGPVCAVKDCSRPGTYHQAALGGYFCDKHKHLSPNHLSDPAEMHDAETVRAIMAYIENDT